MPRTTIVLLRRLCLLLLLCVATPAAAQGLAAAVTGGGKSAAAAAPADAFGRDTPRGLANGLIGALAAQDYDRAAHYFDLSNVPQDRRIAVGAASARRLQTLLDSGGSLVPFLQLSNDPAGDVGDDLPPDQEQIGQLPPDHGRQVPLVATLSSLPGSGTKVWRISLSSRAAIAAINPTASATDALRDKLPGFLTDTQVAGAPLSDWLILIVLAGIFYEAVRLAFAATLAIVARWRGSTEDSRLWRLIHAASSPLSVWIAMLLFLATTRSLEVAIVARQFVSRFAGAIAAAAFAWFLWRLVDVVVDFMALRMAERQRLRARSILIFLRRAVKVTLLIVAGVVMLDTFGVDVRTGIAALGLGGLAIALGAQKTVENIVGSISVIADEPIRIGDFCKVGDVVGTVEDIGIRSTRIRTNERTRVTIPNGNFAALQIENYTLRDRFLFNPTLGFTYDLDADGVERVLAAVRAALKDADFLFAGARATFTGFGDSALEISVFGWINVHDFTESLYLKEKLLLDIMRRATAAGGVFAFPTTSIHVESADGLRGLIGDRPVPSGGDPARP